MQDWKMWWDLASPFIASGLTGCVGFLIYRSQKRIDRIDQLHRLKREAYSSYLAAHNAYVVDKVLNNEKRHNVAIFQSMMEASGQVLLLAPRSVEDMLVALQAGEDKEEEKKLSLRDLAREMRNDLFLSK